MFCNVLPFFDTLKKGKTLPCGRGLNLASLLTKFYFKIRVILYSTHLFLPSFKHFLTEEGSQIIQIKFKI
jgi:hypothetical protein